MPPLDALIPGSIGLLLCTGVVVGFGRVWRLGRASRSWPTAPGRITASRVVFRRRSKSGPTATLEVTYEFDVEGRKISGNRRYFGDFTDANAGVAEAESKRYPVGAEVTVHFRPGDPATCTLEPRTDWRVPGATLLALGIGLAILRALVVGE